MFVRRTFVALFLGLAVLGLGCDGGAEDQPAPAEGGPDVSSPGHPNAATGGAENDPGVQIAQLTTPERLQEITGLSFKPAVESARQSNVAMGYFQTADDAGSVSLSVYVQNADNAVTQYSAMPGMTPVEGVGEAAWWSDTLGLFVTRKGQRVLVVELRSIEGDLPGWSRQIATEVLTNL